MLNVLTWKQFLRFLLEQKEKGLLEEDADVMLHNLETGDEYPCAVLEIPTGRLVMAINWDTLD